MLSTNPKDYWTLVKTLRKNSHHNEPAITLETWENHFRKLYTNHSDENKELSNILNDKIQKYTSAGKQNKFIDDKITEKEISLAIRKQKYKKAHGSDYITNEMIKSASTKIIKPLTKLFNCILQTGNYPSAWNISWITPIYKKGNKQDPNNYRAISVSSCLSKLFTYIINVRFDKFCTSNNIIPQEQIGFCKGHGTNDHIFVLRTIIDCMKRSKKPLYCAFIDFSKAFDSVWHLGLFYKLLQLNVGSTFLKLIKNMYTHMVSRVKQNGHLSEIMQIEIGTKQGCNISPGMFKIYLSDLPAMLTKQQCDPVYLNDKRLSCLLYADDLILISKSANGLQNSLNLLNAYCEKWKLKINFNKSKVMVFNNRKERHIFKINKRTLEVVTSYTYLGITFHKSGSFNPAIKELACKAKKAYFSLSKTVLSEPCSPKVGTHIFDTMIKPICLYGSEVWGAYILDWNKYNFKEKIFLNETYPFEKLHIKYCKRILGLSRKASNFGSKCELGRFPIMLNIIQSIVRFISFTLTKSQESLVYKAMLQQIKYNLSHVNTFLKIARLANIRSIPKLVNGRISPNFTSNIIKKWKDWYIKDIFENIKHTTITNKTSKLRTFFKLKHRFEYERYLNTINFENRKNVSKLRLSDHKLPIERGRYLNIPVKDRLCTLCADGTVGDEFHMLMTCKHVGLTELRKQFELELLKVIPQITNLSLLNKFIYIFSLTDMNIMNTSVRFVSNCMLMCI
jgi:hypothetical protein